MGVALEEVGVFEDVVGLIQGGVAGPTDVSELESLGTVFYEPLWWFRKREPAPS